MKEIKEILDEIQYSVKGVNKEKTLDLIEAVCVAKKINVIGSGRSWHVAKSFSMRLKHLGKKTGRVGKLGKDLTIVISGSGETKDILKIIKKIKRRFKKRGKIICITSNEYSDIAKQSDLVIKLKTTHSKQPLRSLFEQAAFVYLDAIIVILMKKLKVSEAAMWRRHK